MIFFICLLVGVTLYYLNFRPNGIGIPLAPHRFEYDLLVVADRDTKSYLASDKVWTSALIRGRLKRKENGNELPTYSVEWGSPKELRGKMVEGERGMELSELKYFDNKLYTFDDRTGIGM